MRSRYCAFALENARYLLETWHPSTRPREIRFEPGREWRLLKIKNARADGDKAVVAFEARSRLDGRGHVMGETSRFVFQNGRWLYVDGDVRTGALGTS
ncbi:MAG: YchJ family metal-binding protein [Pseudomonadota bacterium]